MAFPTKSYKVLDVVVSWIVILVVDMTTALDTGSLPILTMGTFLITTFPTLPSLH